MENFNNPSSQPQMGNNMMPPGALPNATAVLVLGIVAIVGCCCYGLPGLICGIIAIILAKKDMKLYAMNPSAYTPSSLSNLKTGRILAIIAIVLSIIYIIYVIFILSYFGWEIMSDPEAMREILEQYSA